MKFKKYLYSFALCTFVLGGATSTLWATESVRAKNNIFAGTGTLSREEHFKAERKFWGSIHAPGKNPEAAPGEPDAFTDEQNHAFAQRYQDSLDRSAKRLDMGDDIAADEAAMWAKINPFTSPKTIAAAVALTAGVYGAYSGVRVFFNHLYSVLEKPPFVEDTNDEGFMTKAFNYFVGSSNINRAPSEREVVINESHRREVEKMANGIKNAIEYNLPSANYLFYGPPGTGKTMMARQLAYLTGLKYYIIKASAFTEKDGAENFRMLMRRIRSKGSRAIVFIDEAEQLLRHRTQLKTRARQVFSLILDELGDTNSRSCTFIFASNLPDDIDKAMCDRLELVEFVLPNFESRRQIITNDLNFYFDRDARSEEASMDISEVTEADIAYAAKITDGMSGRTLSKMIEKLQKDLLEEGLSSCSATYFKEFVDDRVLQYKRSTQIIAEGRSEYEGRKK